MPSHITYIGICDNCGAHKTVWDTGGDPIAWGCRECYTINFYYKVLPNNYKGWDSK